MRVMARDTRNERTTRNWLSECTLIALYVAIYWLELDWIGLMIDDWIDDWIDD